MKRVIVAIRLKNMLLAIVAGVGFLFLATFLIVSPSSYNKNTKEKKYANSKLKNKENVVKKVDSLNIEKVNIYITKKGKIEVLNLEDYITGVVCAEMPASFEIEALKAQAVAARTYTLAHVKEVGGSGCKHAEGGDLCDTVHCQAYINKEERIKLWPEKQAQKYWDKVNTAVQQTSGEVLSYDDGLVREPYYFATSSGKTEDSAEVFSNSIPYLKSVDSLGEERAPKYKSIKIIAYSEFINIINNKYPKTKVSIENVRHDIKVIDRSKVGSVKKIKVGNVTITGDEFRWLFKLNSSNFNIQFNKNDIDILCKGYGHGVGMSQWGADAMAKKGDNYKKILTHYYKGVMIKSSSSMLSH